jgi:propanol-preferring alcohol dehydrogenase
MKRFERGIVMSGRVDFLAHTLPLADLHTKNGTAAGAEGKNITNIKLPHIGGHEGVGQVIAVADGVKGNVKPGDLVGIR